MIIPTQVKYPLLTHCSTTGERLLSKSRVASLKQSSSSFQMNTCGGTEFLEIAPNSWKSDKASEKRSPWPPKQWKWGPQKKPFPNSIWTWTFCKKNASKLVKFGLCSSISDLHTPIWGHHPMLYFPSQIQRNIVLCYASGGHAPPAAVEEQ